MEKTNEISTLASRSQRHCENLKRWTWGKVVIFSLLVTYLVIFVFTLLDLSAFQSTMKLWWGLKYIVLLGFAVVMTYVSRQQEQDKNSGLLSTLICCGILLLAFIFLAVFMFGMISLTVDFYLMLIALAFFVPPTFYLSLAVLNVINSRMLRLLIATASIVLVAGYTLLVFGTYDLLKYANTSVYQGKKIMEYIGIAINYGFEFINIKALTKIECESWDVMAQIFLGLYGGAIITYIGGIAAKENARRTA